MKQTCVILSSLLIAAHCLRSGLYPLVVFCLAMPVLLMIKQRWPATLLQGFLILVGLEWIRTLLAIAAQRSAETRPWLRMAVILGSIAAFAFLSAWLVRPRNPSPSSCGSFDKTKKAP